MFKKILAEKIALPKDFSLPPLLTDEAMRRRESWRKFSGSISVQDVSKLLFYARGFKKLFDSEIGILQKSIVPSAGSRHPIEVYCILRNVDGIKDGVYHYGPEDHLLEILSLDPEEVSLVDEALKNQKNLAHANAIFFLTAITRRTAFKYGPRAYRLIHLDAGHIGQNIYLAGEALGLGVCASGGWDDRFLERLIRIDGKKEIAVYCLVAGKKISADAASAGPWAT